MNVVIESFSRIKIRETYYGQNKILEYICMIHKYIFIK